MTMNLIKGHRTKGTYEYYGSGVYVEVKLQVKTVFGFWLTRAKANDFLKTQDRRVALQHVRTMRLEIADAHGLESSLPSYI